LQTAPIIMPEGTGKPVSRPASAKAMLQVRMHSAAPSVTLRRLRPPRSLQLLECAA
jgi:hypothetical protein